MNTEVKEVNIELNGEEGTIDAPWGSVTVNFEDDKDDINLRLMAHARQQLMYFQKEKATQFLADDIKGYELILATGSEELADKFMEIKSDLRKKGIHYGTNLKVIEILKEKHPELTERTLHETI
jgi:hypothetical protein